MLAIIVVLELRCLLATAIIFVEPSHGTHPEQLCHVRFSVHDFGVLHHSLQSPCSAAWTMVCVAAGSMVWREPGLLSYVRPACYSPPRLKAKTMSTQTPMMRRTTDDVRPNSAVVKTITCVTQSLGQAIAHVVLKVVLALEKKRNKE